MPYTKLFYHFIWGTKGREPLIGQSFEGEIHHMISSKSQENQARLFAVGGIEDHVHLVVSVPPSIALSQFVGRVKGATSHWINNELNLELKFSWQSEYGVVTFGEKRLDTVIEYVKNQRQRHNERRLHRGLERVDQER